MQKWVKCCLSDKDVEPMFFPELNEPARPAAARPVSHDMGGRAAGGSAVRTERRDEIGGIRRIGVMIGPAGG